MENQLKIKALYIVCNKVKSVTINFTTVSYIAVTLPLLKLWMENDKIDVTDTDGIKVRVEIIITTKDKEGLTEGDLEKLLVNKEFNVAQISNV